MNSKIFFIKKICILLVLTGATTGFSDIAVAEGFQWPNGEKSAVSLAYDDSLASQLDVAIPQLDKYGLKGSFYLSIISVTMIERLSDWRAASESGHELGNHSLFHGCSRSKPDREWVADYNDLDTKSVVEKKQEIMTANAYLFAIDGKTERTFTAPCAEVNASGGNYVIAVAEQFVGIKSIDTSDVDTSMSEFDLQAVKAWGPVDVTGAELIAHVKKAELYGTVANFTFHGIGSDYLTVSAKAHEELLMYLNKNQDRYYVDTFINIAKYIRKHNNSIQLNEK